jgi:ABC-type multidrug transport system ATPase subunit
VLDLDGLLDRKPKERATTRAKISALHRRLGATVVYVTHDQVEAMTMATRIAVLDAGGLEQIGTPEEALGERGQLRAGAQFAHLRRGRPRRRARLVDPLDDVARQPAEHRTRRGQPDLMGGARDQFDPDRPLQPPQVLAQRRLRQMQPGRGPTEMQFLRKREK